jgi:hypothetical protein
VVDDPDFGVSQNADVVRTVFDVDFDTIDKEDFGNEFIASLVAGGITRDKIKEIAVNRGSVVVVALMEDDAAAAAATDLVLAGQVTVGGSTASLASTAAPTTAGTGASSSGGGGGGSMPIIIAVVVVVLLIVAAVAVLWSRKARKPARATKMSPNPTSNPVYANDVQHTEFRGSGVPTPGEGYLELDTEGDDLPSRPDNAPTEAGMFANPVYTVPTPHARGAENSLYELGPENSLNELLV